METYTQVRIRRAAAVLRAVRLSPCRWAYRDDATRRWYLASRADLLALADILDMPDPDINDDAYSHWCAATRLRRMTARHARQLDAALRGRTVVV